MRIEDGPTEVEAVPCTLYPDWAEAEVVRSEWGLSRRAIMYDGWPEPEGEGDG